MKTKQLTFLLALTFLFFASSSSVVFADGLDETSSYPSETNGVKIYTSTGNYNIKFYHFKFKLTPENTVLPDNYRLTMKGYSRNPTNYRFNILDEKSSNFKCGQFQVFIPVDSFPLSKEKGGFMILRMAQTLTCEGRTNRLIKEKQDLFFQIKEMVKSGNGFVEVVVELPPPGYLKRNVDFRSTRSRYIDYVGQLKKQ
jgi:hypothetical protein